MNINTEYRYNIIPLSVVVKCGLELSVLMSKYPELRNNVGGLNNSPVNYVWNVLSDLRATPECSTGPASFPVKSHSLLGVWAS